MKTHLEANANINRYPATDNRVSFLKRLVKNLIYFDNTNASDLILIIKDFVNHSVKVRLIKPKRSN